MGRGQDENPGVGSMSSHLYKERKGGPAADAGSLDIGGTGSSSFTKSLGTSRRVPGFRRPQFSSPESLHGFSGLPDGGVPGYIGLCDIIGPTPQTKIKVEFPNCGSSTINITDWIEEHIIAPH